MGRVAEKILAQPNHQTLEFVLESLGGIEKFLAPPRRALTWSYLV